MYEIIKHKGTRVNDKFIAFKAQSLISLNLIIKASRASA